MPFIPSEINNRYNEQKEYEETKLNTGNISASSDDSNNKYSINNNRNESNDNTTTLAYFLELKSILQHLQSSLSTDNNQNAFISISPSNNPSTTNGMFIYEKSQ